MDSKIKHSVRNSIWGILNKVVVLFGQLLIRTIILYVLGVEYLGLNGFFLSVVQILNLTELGFSNAIIYCLYKPLANNDGDTVCALMSYYRKIYRFVGLFILVIGIMIIPFIPMIIKNNDSIETNVIVLYLLYVANTSLSYFLFAYKSALITASQRQDIISKINLIALVIQYILQVVFLIIFKNLYVFVLATIIGTIFNNITIEYTSRRLYSQYICKGSISICQKEEIKRLVTGVMIQKICQTLRNSLDNICLAMFTDLTIVAIYGNYYFFLTTVVSMCSVFTTAISSVIGNSVAKFDSNINYEDMNRLIFGYSWLSGFCFTGMAVLSNPLMEIWAGEQLLFNQKIVFLLCVYYYILSIGDIRALYHSAAGLWWHGKTIWLIEASLNLILNVLLGYMFGVEGILFSTIITVLIINFGFGSKILFKYYFCDKSITQYFISHLKYFFVTFLISLITYSLCSNIMNEKFFDIVLKVLIVIILPNCIYIAVYRKNKFYMYYKGLCYNYITNKK